MAMSSPLYFPPTTPTSQRHFSHFPSHSSPLAASSSPVSQKSSPTFAAHARRREQYKQVASSPTSDGSAQEAPRKAILRERFKAKCLERAQKDRARRVSSKRGLSSDASSDEVDADMDDGEEENDDEYLNDELFSRVMQSVNKKQKHQYKVSYQHDVGSSFDPDLEDVVEWEEELKVPQPINTEPDDLFEEELAAYAEEYELLYDLAADDIFGLSDLEDIPGEEPFDWKGKGRASAPQDMDMD
ncbi:hypothetical protein EIP91_009899 [Steccherinum ochraceum]|uniref:Uncharacterized protein n=1 Tax=Steccherinum ochraceum TaxID=92696 RepID=A0A4R0RNT1_9APHY|nr:hypothetical protein EIP91_009899 [Steccherinum ochraceum]